MLGPWTRGSSQWTADSDDRAWTAGVGASVVLIPKRLNLNTNYTMSLGDFDLTYAGYGVTSFDGTPFPPNSQFAFPARPPRVNQDLHIFDVNLDIPVARKVSFVLGYTYKYSAQMTGSRAAAILGSSPWAANSCSATLRSHTSGGTATSTWARSWRLDTTATSYGSRSSIASNAGAG